MNDTLIVLSPPGEPRCVKIVEPGFRPLVLFYDDLDELSDLLGIACLHWLPTEVANCALSDAMIADLESSPTQQLTAELLRPESLSWAPWYWVFGFLLGAALIWRWWP